MTFTLTPMHPGAPLVIERVYIEALGIRVQRYQPLQPHLTLGRRHVDILNHQVITVGHGLRKDSGSL